MIARHVESAAMPVQATDGATGQPLRAVPAYLRVNPPGRQRKTRTLEQRFWCRVQKGDDCWEYTGSRSNGYGEIGDGRGGKLGAHRVSWMLHFGEIPTGLFVCHHCDNPSCVRPGHLFLGTHADNMADMDKKGRRRRAFGGQTHCKRGHEFTPENTRLIAGKRRRCRTCASARQHQYRDTPEYRAKHAAYQRDAYANKRGNRNDCASAPDRFREAEGLDLEPVDLPPDEEGISAVEDRAHTAAWHRFLATSDDA